MKSFSLIAFFLMLTFLFPGFLAGSEHNKSLVHYDMVQLERIGMDEAIERALNAIPGKVIEAEMDDGIYEIKIWSEEGWISEVYVDPWDGSILKIKSKHRHDLPPRSEQLNNKNVKILV